MMTVEESGLSPKEFRRLETYSVESQRQRYSNEELWERLLARHEREMEILKELPLAYRMAFSWRNDAKYWRRIWNGLTLELDANKSVSDLIIWHLTKRGDEAISGWVIENEELKRECSKKWQTEAFWKVEL